MQCLTANSLFPIPFQDLIQTIYLFILFLTSRNHAGRLTSRHDPILGPDSLEAIAPGGTLRLSLFITIQILEV